MDVQARPAKTASLHPILWVAAISVTAFSAMGIAALTGAFERTPASAPATTLSAAAATEAVAPAQPLAAEAPVAAAEPSPAPKAATQAATQAVAVEKPVTRVPAAPKKTQLAAHDEARPVRVASQTYDSGIDVIPAGSQAAAEPAPRADSEYRAPAPVCADCGIVESVHQVQAPADPSGLGAAAGGVVGGLLGNNVGKGSGRTIATLIGIAGGAYAGHQIEKTQRTTARHEVGVRMDNGEYRTVTLDSAPTWQVGDKVKIRDGKLALPD